MSLAGSYGSFNMPYLNSQNSVVYTSTDATTWGGSITSGYSWPGSSIVFGSANTVKLANDRISASTIEEIAKEARKWAEEFCKESPHFQNSLQGICSIASRFLFKELKYFSDGLAIKFAYIKNDQFRHIFCIITEGLDCEYVIDITADIYGENSVCVIKKEDIDPIAKPWWDATIFYKSESGLIARQRKDKWPEHQITLQAAKQVSQKYKLVTDGESNVEDGLIRVMPPDKEALQLLKKHAKGDLFNTTLAKLMLDSNPTIELMANTIAKEILKR
jgi:hypothetical protein